MSQKKAIKNPVKINGLTSIQNRKFIQFKQVENLESFYYPPK